MHANAFDRYHAAPSLVHTLDPRIKVVFTVLFIVSNVLMPDAAWAGFFLAWTLLLGANLLAGLGPGFTFKRSYIALPFALVAVTTLFSVPGEELASGRFGPWMLVVTGEGVLRFTSILLRSWLSVQMAILLVATTRFPDLMHALFHLKVPPVIVSVISFMYRYLFVLADEAMRLMRAREARSARLPQQKGGGSLVWRARVTGHMAGQLFLRSFERSEQIYNAMLARGYDGRLLTLNQHEMQARDWWAGVLSILALVVVQIASRL